MFSLHSLSKPPAALAAALLAAMLLVACGGGGETADAPPAEGGTEAKPAYDGPPVEGDWLITYLRSDPETLNFVWGTSATVSEVARYVGDSLFDYDKELNVIPRLAESWEWSPDYLAITVKARSGVRWHDGAPFTMHDVKFNIDKIMDPKSRADNRMASYEKVKRVEVLDDLTLRIHYKEPFAAAMSVLADGAYLVPKHIFEKEDWFKSEYNSKPVGLGPYKMVEWVRGSHIMVERNEDYWGAKPHLKRIVWKIKGEDTVRFQSLLSGEIDMAEMKSDQWAREASSPEFEKRFQKLIFYESSFQYIGWNMDGSNPYFADKRVRHAMAHAFDREHLNKSNFGGLRKLAVSSLHPDSWAFNPNLKPWPYDVEKAKALLDEAGWRDSDGDGIRNKGGRPFRFTFIIPSQSETANVYAVRLKEELRKIGVDMEIQAYEWAEYLRRVKNSEYQAYSGSWRLGIDPVDEYDLWHSSQHPDGINYVKFSNAEVDRLLSDARKEFDKEKRKQMYWRAQEIIYEEQPYLFMYYAPILMAVDKRFRGLEVSPKGMADFYPGFLGWWVPPAEQRYGK